MTEHDRTMDRREALKLLLGGLFGAGLFLEGCARATPTPRNLTPVAPPSTPTPGITPTRTPTPVPPDTQTPVPVISATPPTQSPASTRAPTQTATLSNVAIPKKAIVYNYHGTKIRSYAWENNLDVEVVETGIKYQEGIIGKLKSGKYSGACVGPSDDLQDATVFALSEFVKNGGRAFLEVYDERGAELSEAFQNYLDISIASEWVVLWGDSPYFIDGNSIRLFEGLRVGFDNREGWEKHPWGALDSFFLSKKDGIYKTVEVKSESTNLPRSIAAYGKLGEGEIILFMTYGTYSIIDDYIIDKYNNKEGGLRVLRWLTRNIDYPK